MQFVNPLFLIGLVAIAVPVLVHLFNFRRYKKVYFSNVDLLLQLQSETQKQSQLRQWLVLLARILAIVFLVLAFAQPILPKGEGAVKKGIEYVSVYIDNSYSMESTSLSGTLLETAKAKAAEIAKSYKPSDRLQLITNDVEGRHFRFVSPDEFLKLVDQVEVSSSSVSLSDMIEKQYDFLNSNAYDNKSVYVISDYQTSFSAFDKFPIDSNISTYLLPISSSRVNNIYIDSVALNTPVLRKGANITIDVHVKNTGDAEVEKLPIKLLIDGKQRAIASADIAANSQEVVPLNFTIEETGNLNAKIVTNDYPIIYDDDFYFSLNVSDNIKVLSVNGNAENKYLNILFGNDSAFVYENISDKTIDFDKISDYDFIILNELKTIPSALVQTLCSYVESRGSILIIPAENADLESYKYASMMLKMPQMMSFAERVSEATYINVEHRLYDGVFEKKTDDMSALKVFKYYATKKDANTVSESLITLANGDDFLTVTPLGKGCVYAFATALKTSHTDFVKQAMFVPTLYNMALYSIPAPKLYYTISSTDDIALLTTFSGKEIVAKLVSADNDFEIIPEITTRANKSFMNTYGQIKQSGNYVLKLDDKVVESFSFNHNRNESEMEFCSNNDIKSNIKGFKLNNYKLIDNPEIPIDKYLTQESNAIHLWKIFVVLALLMLLFEIALLRFWKV